MSENREGNHGARPRIALFSLGGTIAMVPEKAGGVVPGLTAQDLVESNWLGQAVSIVPESVLQIASANLTFGDILSLAERVRRAVQSGADGVVITQGTDTLEESAFLLDVLLDVPVPIVMTGAMRSPTFPGADGPANLMSAVRVAASAEAAGIGVLAVMNDEIHAARFVRKMHTHLPSAFASPPAGPIGWVVEDRVRIALRPNNRAPQVVPRAEPPFVALLTVALATDECEVDAIVAGGAAGLVLAGTGSGHVAARFVDRIATLAARMPVVLSSRIGIGEGYRATYGYPGGEIDLLRRGLIFGGCLDPLKARLLLSLLLAEGADRARIESVFSYF